MLSYEKWLKHTFEKDYIKWQKLYVNGAQNTCFNEKTQEIVYNEKLYWWEENKVFNFLKPLIDSCKDTIAPSKLWGSGKLVCQLIPYQEEYNRLMNFMSVAVSKLYAPILTVEDGSVDTDALCDEGLSPGKVLLYRQGSNKPEIVPLVDKDTPTKLYELAQCIKQECVNLFDALLESILE